jgi:hypothetical protein
LRYARLLALALRARRWPQSRLGIRRPVAIVRRFDLTLRSR